MDNVTREFNHGVDDYNAAELLSEKRMYAQACNRYYYAVFHCLQACLQLKGLQYKSHSQAQGAFNKFYIHEGIFPPELSRYVAVTSSVRDKSDYDLCYDDNAEDTARSADCARKFIKCISEYLFENGFYAIKMIL